MTELSLEERIREGERRGHDTHPVFGPKLQALRDRLSAERGVPQTSLSPAAQRRAEMDFEFTPRDHGPHPALPGQPEEAGFQDQADFQNRLARMAMAGMMPSTRLALEPFIGQAEVKRAPSGDAFIVNGLSPFPQNLSRAERDGPVWAGLQDAGAALGDYANSATLRLGDDVIGGVYDLATGGDDGAEWAQETNDFGEFIWQNDRKAQIGQTLGVTAGALAPSNVATQLMRLPGAAGRVFAGSTAGRMAANALGAGAAVQGIAQGDGNFDAEFADELLSTDIGGMAALAGGDPVETGIDLRTGVPMLAAGLTGAVPAALGVGGLLGRLGGAGSDEAATRIIARDLARDGVDPALVRREAEAQAAADVEAAAGGRDLSAFGEVGAPPGASRASADGPIEDPLEAAAARVGADQGPITMRGAASPRPAAVADAATRRGVQGVTPDQMRDLAGGEFRLLDVSDRLQRRAGSAARLGGEGADALRADLQARAAGRAERQFNAAVDGLGEHGNTQLLGRNQTTLARNPRGADFEPVSDPLRYDRAPEQLLGYQDDLAEGQRIARERGYNELPGSRLFNVRLDGSAFGRPDIVSTFQAADELNRLAREMNLLRVANQIESVDGIRYIEGGRTALPEPKSLGNQIIDPIEKMSDQQLANALFERRIPRAEMTKKQRIERLKKERDAERNARPATDEELMRNPVRIQQIKRAAEAQARAQMGPNGDGAVARNMQTIANMAREVLETFRDASNNRPGLIGNRYHAAFERSLSESTNAAGDRVVRGAYVRGQRVFSDSLSATEVMREVRELKRKVAKAQRDTKLDNKKKKSGLPTTRENVARAAEEELHAYRLGAMDGYQRVIQSQTMTGARSLNPDIPRVEAKLRAIFDNDAQADQYMMMLERERRMKASEATVLGGSQTAERVADDAALASEASGRIGEAADVFSMARSGINYLAFELLGRGARAAGDWVATGMSTKVADELARQLNRQDLAAIADAMERAAREGKPLNLSMLPAETAARVEAAGAEAAATVRSEGPLSLDSAGRPESFDALGPQRQKGEKLTDDDVAQLRSMAERHRDPDTGRVNVRAVAEEANVSPSVVYRYVYDVDAEVARGARTQASDEPPSTATAEEPSPVEAPSPASDLPPGQRSVSELPEVTWDGLIRQRVRENYPLEKASLAGIDQRIRQLKTYRIMGRHIERGIRPFGAGSPLSWNDQMRMRETLYELDLLQDRRREIGRAVREQSRRRRADEVAARRQRAEEIREQRQQARAAARAPQAAPAPAAEPAPASPAPPRQPVRRQAEPEIERPPTEREIRAEQARMDRERQFAEGTYRRVTGMSPNNRVNFKDGPIDGANFGRTELDENIKGAVNITLSHVQKGRDPIELLTREELWHGVQLLDLEVPGGVIPPGVRKILDRAVEKWRRTPEGRRLMEIQNDTRSGLARQNLEREAKMIADFASRQDRGTLGRAPFWQFQRAIATMPGRVLRRLGLAIAEAFPRSLGRLATARGIAEKFDRGGYATQVFEGSRDRMRGNSLSRDDVRPYNSERREAARRRRQTSE